MAACQAPDDVSLRKVVGIPATFYTGAAIEGTITEPFPFYPWYSALPVLATTLFISPIGELGWRGVPCLFHSAVSRRCGRA